MEMRKDKIRILHIAQAAGGVDRYIRMLLKYLDKEKFENILVCSQDFREEDYKNLVDFFEQVKMDTMRFCLCRWIPKNMSARQNFSLSCTSMLRERTRFSRKRSRLLRLRFLSRGRFPCLTSWSRSRNRKSSQPPQRLRNPKRQKSLRGISQR